MRALLASVALAAACYHPAAQSGVPCSSSGECPSGQRCDLARTPAVCVPDGDPVGADAAPTCLTGLACPAEAPVCDPSGACRGCSADAECGAGVCHERTGLCVADADTLYVSPAGTDLGSTCTRAQPCATIQHALSLVAGTRRFIRVGNGLYPDKVSIPNPDGSALPIVLSGEDADPAGAEISTGGDTVSTDPSAVVELEGLRITASGNSGIITRGDVTLSRVAVLRSQGAGVDARSGKVRVLDCTIADGRGRGVVTGGADLELQRSVITGNVGGGIDVSGVAFTIVNTIIGANGSAISAMGGVRIGSGATPLAFRFNTIAGNQVSLGSPSPPGVDCNTAVTIESTLFADNSRPPLSSQCAARYSLFGGTAPAGEGNLVGVPAFRGSGDYHITGGSPARDHADPAATEDRDVDSELRSDGRRDIGADELP